MNNPYANAIDASRLEKDITLEADAVIVGSGAGGGITAEILTQAGFRVIIIEEGGLARREDFKLKEMETFQKLYYDGGNRSTKGHEFSVAQGRTVGGSTVVNWTTCLRTPPQTFDYWKSQLKIEGYSSDEMAPFYDWAEKRLHVSDWTAHNVNNSLLARGAEKLGWSYRNIPRNVKSCYALGFCGLGCPTDAKQSMLITTIPEALKRNATLLYRSRAVRFEWKGDKINELVCHALNPEGTAEQSVKIRIRARLYVSSAGAINTPALLLRSGFPDPHALTGKRTFVQMHNYSIAIMPDAIAPFTGAPQSVASDYFLFADGVSGRAGYNIEAVGAQPVVMMNFRKIVGDDFEEYVRNLSRVHILVSQIRDGFSEQSQGGVVSLNERGQGILDYPFSDFIKDGIRRSYLSMAECQFAAGAEKVTPANNDVRPFRSWNDAKEAITDMPIRSPNTFVNSTHPLGGCAMGVDERTSVVDTHGRHHHIANLAVIDGSLFPTGLGVNPSLTVYAVAAKLARFHSNELRRMI
ncbi:MAG: GMC family oxidoreductase [Leptonema illini]|uniref:GMC family oxidoreductase n=1 Tax=Leptonema illini TaxID=183 RepID=A0A833M2C9_9LEPT|nr:MAG: GMC family oxidoreductase [Leptonema illini]